MAIASAAEPGAAGRHLLGPVAIASALREYYRRQVRKFGGFRSPAANKKAIIAVAHKLIVIIWHVLATGRPYQDLGADYFTTRMDPDKERRRLVAKLEAQGLGVTLEPAA